MFGDVLATFEKPPVAAANPMKMESSWADSPSMSEADAETDLASWSADCWQTSLGASESVTATDSTESLALAEPIDVLDSLCQAETVESDESNDESVNASYAPDATEPVNVEESADPTEPTDEAVELQRRWDAIANHEEPTNDLPTLPPPVFSFTLPPAAEEPPAPAETPAAPQFKPAWQVDRFTWPRICRRLVARAAEEFNRLADALLAANARGQKALAIAGCCRGEGATTLLLCAARRLAERGIKLILVNADLNRPRLAKRLGVQPQSGWNETSDDGGTSSTKRSSSRPLPVGRRAKQHPAPAAERTTRRTPPATGREASPPSGGFARQPASREASCRPARSCRTTKSATSGNARVQDLWSRKKDRQRCGQ